MAWLKKNRDKLLLLLILLLTAYLAGWKIWAEGEANAYYTAAVKSMLTSWHNFFYASFDPGGFITVDKPALGLWLQCLSALVFGVHGWSVILPEVLCSVVSVAVLYHLVGRSFGPAAGLLAALFLAVTPIFIAATRTNNLDASLVMVCLLAMWAVVVAAERGSLKHLLLSVVLIGLGFNIKMLQAYFYVPALYLVYFFTAETKWSKRVIHLAIATAVLAAVSLSWCVAVDLTPAQNRPYVGSSATNSELDLALGYNGIARVLEANVSVSADSTLGSLLGGNSGVPNEGGTAGVLRLFNREMAGQISWLLILAGFGVLALLLRLLSKKERDKKPLLRQLLLWIGLLVPMAVFFSTSGHFHRYYLIIFAPVLAALAAIGVCESVMRFHRDPDNKRFRWDKLLLPGGVTLTSASQIFFLTNYYARYSKTLVIIISCCTVLFLLGLTKKKLVIAAVTIGLLGLLAAPTYWAHCPIEYGTNAAVPYGGPLDPYNSGTVNTHSDGGGTPPDGGPSDGQHPQPPAGVGAEDGKGSQGGPVGLFPGGVQAEFMAGMNRLGFMGAIPDGMVSYMIRNNNGSRFLVAVPNAAAAEPIILRYGVGVMALGGFKGSDKAITPEQFIALVRRGELQYFWVGGNVQSEITLWVEQNGKRIDAGEWNGGVSAESDIESKTMGGLGSLYDLSGLKSN